MDSAAPSSTMEISVDAAMYYAIKAAKKVADEKNAYKKAVDEKAAEEELYKKSTNKKRFHESINPEHMEVIEENLISCGAGGRFSYLCTKVLNKMNKKINPTFVLLRGNSVAILIIITNIDDGKKYILITEQLRAPTGGNCFEAVAGMMDDKNNPMLAASEEIKEETGIVTDDHKIIFLGEYYTSPGIMEEMMKCYLMESSMNTKKIEELTDKHKLHGDGSDFESIRLHIIPATWEEVMKTKDGKLIASFAMYKNQVI
jgi:8-oxo-dGTP pyrophosphatase MutT (NUDIX family)